MSWEGRDEEEQAAVRTTLATSEAMLSRLRRAVSRSNLGGSGSWPLSKRASHCLRLLGGGRTVSIDSPRSVRRAITIIENYKPSAGP
jgi:hypothetical protein